MTMSINPIFEKIITRTLIFVEDEDSKLDLTNDVIHDLQAIAVLTSRKHTRAGGLSVGWIGSR